MDVQLIYGPPGTGKTTKLMAILEEELKTNNPDKIAFVSFTRKGTYEGRDRAKEKFNLRDEDFPYFRTIHSLAFRALGLNKGDMIQKHHYKMFSEATGMKFTGFYTEDFKNDDDRYLFFNSLYRNNADAADFLLGELNPKILRWVTAEYKRFRFEMGLMDFTDILEIFVKEKNELPVDIAIIDEAQDLTTLQWQFVWKAFKKCKKIYIAGDDDQAIYEWSGADVHYFLNIRGKSEVLQKSWRLPSEIHKYALSISNQIGQRIPKVFSPNKEGGKISILNSIRELPLDNMTDWMILCRNSYYLKEAENFLRNQGILYWHKDRLSFDPRVLRAIKAHSKIMKEEQTSEADRMILSTLMGNDLTKPFTEPWYKEFTELDPETIEYYRNIVFNNPDPNRISIRLSTIHGVKGGQATNVVLLMDYSHKVYKHFNKDPDSELRCYYVAVTRAKENLYLVLPQTNNGYKVIKE